MRLPRRSPKHQTPARSDRGRDADSGGSESARARGLLHIETPLNPTGEARNVEYNVAKTHQAGAHISVDAPPPLQDPLQYGVDIVMHRGLKCIGAHSDMLCSVLVVYQDRKE